MRPEQTALFSDLDGTLFNSSGKVSPENRRAIENYIAAGGCFALSTGRTPVNVRLLVGDLPVNAPSIVLNGSGVYDFARERMEWALHLDGAKLFPLLRWALKELPGLDLQVYTDDGIFYCTPEESAHPGFLAMHRPCSFVSLDSLEDREIIKVLLLPREADLDRLGRRLEEEGESWMNGKPGAVYMEGSGVIRFFELMPPGATKGAALRRLRSHPALAGRTLLGIGDYWNDYELLREADIAVAPANAPAEIQALCRYVTVSNDDHAIRAVLEELLPRL